MSTRTDHVANVTDSARARRPDRRDRGRGPFVRNVDAPALFEDFLISAIVTILVIRLFLHVAGYPTVGGDALHIAHMLWGGLFMAVAIVALLTFLGPAIRPASAVLAGIGFGTFIDELGKFITHDNDYFYQPTVALIYVVFVLFYLAFRALHLRDLTRHELVANALDTAHEAVRGDLDETERQRAIDLLERARPLGPVGEALLASLGGTRTVQPGKPPFMERWKRRVRAVYDFLIQQRWFPLAVVGFFVGYSIVMLVKTLATVERLWPLVALVSLALLVVPAALRSTLRPGRAGLPRRVAAGLVPAAFVVGLVLVRGHLPALSLWEWGELTFTVLPALLVVSGILKIRESRLAAYQRFQYAVLILIFVAQFFAFYQAEFLALFGLVANLVVLATLRYMIRQEGRLRHEVVA